MCLISSLGLATACSGDPPAPGVSGTLSLASNVDAGQWATVELRACPADAGTAPACLMLTGDGLLSRSIQADGGLPVAYRLADGVGASPRQGWKVVAWLNRGTAGSAPAAGEWWGSAAFTLRDCSYACSGTCYCGEQTGVDVVIAQQAP